MLSVSTKSCKCMILSVQHSADKNQLYLIYRSPLTNMPGPGRHKNQYTKNGDLEESRASYEWLLLQSSVASNHSSEKGVACWTPKGKGISKTASGYLRFNHAGRKILCHVFTWQFSNPEDIKDGDVSHLCRNKECCRPSHLVKEDRSKNKSRDNCPGIISCSVHHDESYRLCRHEPRCLFTTAFSCIADRELPLGK